jgi:thiol-disulfide isomerase/thioredoxin
MLLIPLFTLAFSSCRKASDPKAPDNQANSEHQHDNPRINSQTNGSSPTDNLNTQTDKQPLSQVIRNAKSWSPTLTNWQGRQAPELAMKNLEGEKISIKSHKGKDIMLVFWATWCPPCRMEIPHLKHLRNEKSDDELEIIAVSNENPQTVKRFARSEKLNYTVATVPAYGLPAPYSRVQGIPTTIFVDSQGKIKVTATGVMTTEETKAVLNAAP